MAYNPPNRTEINFEITTTYVAPNKTSLEFTPESSGIYEPPSITGLSFELESGYIPPVITNISFTGSAVGEATMEIVDLIEVPFNSTGSLNSNFSVMWIYQLTSFENYSTLLIDDVVWALITTNFEAVTEIKIPSVIFTLGIIPFEATTSLNGTIQERVSLLKFNTISELVLEGIVVAPEGTDVVFASKFNATSSLNTTLFNSIFVPKFESEGLLNIPAIWEASSADITVPIFSAIGSLTVNISNYLFVPKFEATNELTLWAILQMPVGDVYLKTIPFESSTSLNIPKIQAGVELVSFESISQLSVFDIYAGIAVDCPFFEVNNNLVLENIRLYTNKIQSSSNKIGAEYGSTVVTIPYSEQDHFYIPISLYDVVHGTFCTVLSILDEISIGIISTTNALANQGNIHSLSGFGDQSVFTDLEAISDTKLFSFLLQIGTSSQAVQAICGILKGSLEDIISSNIQSTSMTIKEREMVSGILGIFNAILSSTKGMISGTNYIAEGADGLQSTSMTIKEREMVSGILTAYNSIINSIKGMISGTNYIAEGADGLQLLDLDASCLEISAVQTIIHTILERNEVFAYQSILNSLKSLTTQNFSCVSNIYLDGIKINNLVEGNTVTITFNNGSIHNEVSITSISEDLYKWANPHTNPGTVRLEVHVGTRVLFFLLEERNGSGANFTLWGRDQTARDSEPWAVNQSIYLDESTLASSVVEGLTKYSVIDWEISDFMLPVDFEASGTPLEIAQAIAVESGGILRAQDDGSIRIKKKYSSRPINLASQTAEYVYNGSNIIDFTHKESIGSRYNSVAVSSGSYDTSLPTIELEDLGENETRYPGTTSYVRVYWKTDDYLSIDATYVTDGLISHVPGSSEDKTYIEEVTELIEFKSGIGNTKYPIHSLGSIEWIGDSSVIDSWSKFGTDLKLEESDIFRIANVTYFTEYSRYILKDHNVESLLAVFYFEDFPFTNILVMTEPVLLDTSNQLINKQGADISLSYALTGESIAVERGEQWIDENKYDELIHTFSSPYNDAIKDGIIVWVDAERNTSPGNYFVENVTITISGPVVSNTVEVKKWKV